MSCTDKKASSYFLGALYGIIDEDDLNKAIVDY